MDRDMRLHLLLHKIEHKSHKLNQMIGRALSQNAGILQIQIFKKSEEIDQLTIIPMEGEELGALPITAKIRTVMAMNCHKCTDFIILSFNYISQSELADKLLNPLQPAESHFSKYKNINTESIHAFLLLDINILC